MVPNTPLRFLPVFRSYIWGGTRLAAALGKHVPTDGIWAESWEIVDHGADQSVVADGDWSEWTLRQLVESFPDEILGSKASEMGSFPLLLKYLDCQRVLSVQVHPEDNYGKKMTPPDLGKTEAWYVVDAAPDAKIYAGLKAGVDREQLAEAIAEGKTEECLHVIQPSAGDCVFIPAGTVHALGDGLLIAEIQQASDTTFRLFDWNRVDADGKPRPLHIQQALDVIDYKTGPVQKSQPRATKTAGLSTLVECDKFHLQKLESTQPYAVPNDNRFRIVTFPKGSGQVRTADGSITLGLGESILLPAERLETSIQLDPDSASLIMFLP